ncbi:MAG: cyclopropane-fatty-acyl-phospholipid synthase family protein [Pirellulales bacterium]|nr:cyclopropane-fatty-acyl-phospholipid synthase family protein [Pirellulales bacterium]
MGSPFSSDAQLRAITDTLTKVGDALDLRVSVKLWNGDVIPLGKNPDPNLLISLASPGVVGSLLRKPTAENLLRHYATGGVDLVGGNLIEFREAVRMQGSSRKKLKALPKGPLLRNAIPFLFAKTKSQSVENAFADDAIGRQESKRNNKDYIQFHYDVGNEFYKLFLDKEMQYSCGYFTDRNNSLEQAQLDKLEMICRKLRLEPGEKMLDIGCGWGGLICYAAQHYGVKAHGITLSQQQHDLVQEKIKRLGLTDLVTVELRDYSLMEGQFDKIASIGMFEHIGVANYPRYFKKVRSLLKNRGILLNHAIARSSKRTKKKARYVRPERKLLLKYIFPGSELTSVGFTSDAMEHEGFEVHDCEAWREHYALTCKAWCERLTSHRDEAIKLVGEERYRLWAAYLAGASCGFADGGIKIYQVVATKRAGKGASGLPLTRADLYEDRDQQKTLRVA